MSKLYQVTMVFRSYGRVLVEAKDEEQAWEIARELDGSDFVPEEELDGGYGGDCDLFEVAEAENRDPRLPIFDEDIFVTPPTAT